MNKLEIFLMRINRSESEIVNYIGEEALRAVKRNGYALQYVDKRAFK